MKTAVIYTIDGDFPVMFILDGDFTHLDGVYARQDYDDDDQLDKQDELMTIVYGPDYEGDASPVDILDSLKKIDRAELVKAIRDGADLIVCGATSGSEGY